MATSKFEKRITNNAGNPLLGATVELCPQANTYPTGKILLTEHPTRKGWYYKDAISLGEYKIYINGTLYTQNIFHAENILVYIAALFDENLIYTGAIKALGTEYDFRLASMLSLPFRATEVSAGYGNPGTIIVVESDKALLVNFGESYHEGAINDYLWKILPEDKMLESIRTNDNIFTGNNTFQKRINFDAELTQTITADTDIDVSSYNALFLLDNTESSPTKTVALTNPTNGQLLFVTNSASSTHTITVGSVSMDIGKSVLMRYRTTDTTWYVVGL